MASREKKADSIETRNSRSVVSFEFRFSSWASRRQLMILTPSALAALLWFGTSDLAQAGTRLILLHPVDIAIIAIYFAMVLGIGFYLQRYTKSGEDFFLA